MKRASDYRTSNGGCDAGREAVTSWKESSDRAAKPITTEYSARSWHRTRPSSTGPPGAISARRPGGRATLSPSRTIRSVRIPALEEGLELVSLRPGNRGHRQGLRERVSGRQPLLGPPVPLLGGDGVIGVGDVVDGFLHDVEVVAYMARTEPS